MLFQGYPERILAFYLAYKRGIRDDLVRLFAKRYLVDYQKKKNAFMNEYLSIHEPKTVPAVLWKKLRPILQSEVTRIRRELSAFS